MSETEKWLSEAERAEVLALGVVERTALWCSLSVSAYELEHGRAIDSGDIERMKKAARVIAWGELLPVLDLEELESRAVKQALAKHNGNRTRAARELGVNVRTLQRKIRVVCD